MKGYKALALAGGILGISVVPALLLVSGIATAFLWVFDPASDIDVDGLEGATDMAIMATIISSVAAMVVPFVVKNTKVAGIVLFGAGAVIIAASQMYGIGSWVLVILAGVLAIRTRPSAALEPAKH